MLGARIDLVGNILDPGGFPIATGGGHRIQPRVATDGNIALVVWNQSEPSWELRAARIDSGGNVLDPDGFVVAASSTATLPQVDFDGTDFLVVWSAAPSADLDIYGARVTADGFVRDIGGQLLYAADRDQLVTGLVLTDANHVIVWSELTASETRLGRIQLDLTWLDGPGVTVPAAVQDLEWDGTRLATIGGDFSKPFQLMRWMPDLTPEDREPITILTPSEAAIWSSVPFSLPTRNAALGPAGLIISYAATFSAEEVSPRAYVQKIDIQQGCEVLARTSPMSIACTNQTVAISAADSVVVACTTGATHRWYLDGLELVGELAVTLLLPGLATGSHQVEVEVTCANDPLCTARSAPVDFDVLQGPPAVGPTLMTTRRGGDLHAEWDSLGNVKKYTLLGGDLKSGPFLDVLQTSDVPSIDVPLPPEALRFLRVAVEDQICGTGPP